MSLGKIADKLFEVGNNVAHFCPHIPEELTVGYEIVFSWLCSAAFYEHTLLLNKPHATWF